MANPVSSLQLVITRSGEFSLEKRKTHWLGRVFQWITDKLTGKQRFDSLTEEKVNEIIREFIEYRKYYSLDLADKIKKIEKDIVSLHILLNATDAPVREKVAQRIDEKAIQLQSEKRKETNILRRATQKHQETINLIQDFLNKTVDQQEYLQNASSLKAQLDLAYTPEVLLYLYREIKNGSKDAQKALLEVLSTRMTLNRIIASNGKYPPNSGYFKTDQNLQALTLPNLVSITHHKGLSDDVFIKFIRSRTELATDDEIIKNNRRLKYISFVAQKDPQEVYDRIIGKDLRTDGKVDPQKVRKQFELDCPRQFGDGSKTFLQKRLLLRNVLEEGNQTLSTSFEEELAKEIPDEQLRIKVLVFLQQGGRGDEEFLARALYANFLDDSSFLSFPSQDTKNTRHIDIDIKTGKVTIKQNVERSLNDRDQKIATVNVETVVVLTKDGTDEEFYLTARLIKA